MKILNVYGGTLSSSKIKRIGGIEEHFLAISKEMSLDFSLIYAGETKEEKFLSEIMMNKSSLISLGNKTYFSYYINFIKLLLKHKKSKEELIVHVHFAPIAHIIILISKIFGIRKIYWTKHSRLMINKFSKSWFINKVSSYLVSDIICVSNAIKEEFYKLNLGKKEKINVIPLGLNLNKYSIINSQKTTALYKELSLSPNTFIITIVAQQREEKRVDVFIKALAKLIKTYELKDVMGLVVGDGPLAQSNIALSKELEISNSLKFMGLRHDVDTIYSISDLAGLTSVTEGLPFALMEACAKSLPLFGSNAGGIPEVIQDGYNGFLFDVGDDSKLADIFYTFYSDRIKANTFGNNSLTYLKENYLINNCVHKLITHYHQNT